MCWLKALEVAYCKNARADGGYTDEARLALKHAGPDAAPEMMAITVNELDELDMLAALLAGGAEKLAAAGEDQLSQVKDHAGGDDADGLLTFSRIPLLKKVASRPMLKKAVVWRVKLDDWVASKLTEWDTNPTFRTARKAQHSTRERYERSLRKRADMNFRKQMKTLPLVPLEPAPEGTLAEPDNAPEAK